MRDKFELGFGEVGLWGPFLKQRSLIPVVFVGHHHGKSGQVR